MKDFNFPPLCEEARKVISKEFINKLREEQKYVRGCPCPACKRYFSIKDEED